MRHAPAEKSVNEVKTRLTDRAYDALLQVKAAYGFESDGKALEFIVLRQLFGLVQTIPPALVDRSPAVAHAGTR